MKRYNSVYAGSYTKPHEMVEENDGDWVWFEDVEHLEAINAELLEAVESLIANVYSCACTMPTKEEREAWDKANAAIAKAEGATQ